MPAALDWPVMSQLRDVDQPDGPLIETIKSPQDLKSLTSEEWRARTADSVAKAIDTFFTTRIAGTGRRN